MAQVIPSCILAAKHQASHQSAEMLCQIDKIIITSESRLHEDVKVKSMLCEGVSRVSMKKTSPAHHSESNILTHNLAI